MTENNTTQVSTQKSKLRLGPSLRFFVGLLRAAFIFGLLLAFFLLITFNLAGGESLDIVKGQRWLLLVMTTGVAAILIYSSGLWSHQNKRHKAYGTLAATAVAMLLAAGYLADLYRYEKFDSKVWQEADYKPFRMAAGLSVRNKLDGMTRQEIKKLLGEGREEHEDKNTGNGSIVYDVAGDWSLILYFENGKVNETELRRPHLMT